LCLSEEEEEEEEEEEHADDEEQKLTSCLVLGAQLESTGGFDGAYVVLEAQPPFSFGSSVNEYVHTPSKSKSKSNP
jgi:hypothetical protein